MQSLTESVYKLGPPGGIFDDSVVRNLYPATSRDARKLLLHRAVHKGEVLRLKRGLYCLAQPYRRSQPHPFVLAALLHSPSHISLESALSHHGLIPEAVHEVTSVTLRRSRSFNTPVGHFSFHRVPTNNPRAGVRAVEIDENVWAFIAGPLRAIADTIYLRKDIAWKKDGSQFLTSSMRIEDSDLQEISMDDYEELIESIRDQRTRRYLTGLRKEIAH